jgi:predicted nucleic acid-binding protein
MNGNNILLDSNIVLFLLNGEQTLIPLLEEKQLYISFITQLETLGYKGISEKDSRKIKSFLNECIIIDINPVIKDLTIKLRQEYSVKLPDCIIMATSLYLNAPVITADIDFKKVKELDLILFD